MSALPRMTDEQYRRFTYAKEHGRVLTLNVTAEWFAKMVQLLKRHEFREVKMHWCRILTDVGHVSYDDYRPLGISPEQVDRNVVEKVQQGIFKPKRFDFLVMRNGFARKGSPAPYFIADAPTIEVWHKWENDMGLEWVFAIEIGTILETNSEMYLQKQRGL